jgi:hypothetical protein
MSATARSTESSLVIFTTLAGSAAGTFVNAFQYEPQVDTGYCPPVLGAVWRALHTV